MMPSLVLLHSALRRQRRLRSRLIASVILFTWVTLIWSIPAPAAEPNSPAEVKEFLTSHCLDCHQGKAAEAGLDLETFPLELSKPHIEQRWLRIVDRVTSGEMPPADWGKVDGDLRDQFLIATGDTLRAHQRALHETLGRVRGRRLTRLQVERSLHDLLGIDIPLADRLPENPKTDSFSTVADGQAISHFQLQAHLEAVDVALDEAFRRAVSLPDTYECDFNAEGIARKDTETPNRDPEMREGKAVTWSSGLIFYGRISATKSPEDGWYRFRVTVSGLKPPQTGGVWSTVRTGLCVSSAPLLSDVTIFEALKEPQTIEFTAWLPKEHMLEIRPNDGTLKQGRFGGQVTVGVGEAQDVPGIAFERLTMQRVHLNGDDGHIRQLLFGDLPVKQRGNAKKPYRVRSKSPHVDATQRMTAFASRAFRRPVTPDEIAQYTANVHAALDNGEDFVSALRLGYRSLLCSPRFLYFLEEPGDLDHYEIATRMAYLLTGSTPDEQLLERAGSQQLRDPQVLHAEVERLLADEGARRFVTDFAAEWLDLDQIGFTQPDSKLYPEFDTIVQQSMVRETETFLETMLRENLSVSHLIQSDFTFLNSRLARFYEIDGVAGPALRRVSLSSESRRGGLVTQGAILKVTANGTNTSPVIRGAWMAERLLGDAVPPPPDSVPAVEPDIRGATTIREQLEKHRSQAECASCHVKIDPPGYALENYDAAGQWRDQYLKVVDNKKTFGAAIDASYVLADGREFADVDAFKALVADEPQKLATNVVEKLVTYGTGAPVEFVDREQVEAIVDQAAADNYGLRSLLKAVVTSHVFLSK